MKNNKYLHITITICYNDNTQNTQHSLREFTDEEYDELCIDDCGPDWEIVFQSCLSIDTNGDMDIDDNIISREEFDKLYKQNGWTWITRN